MATKKEPFFCKTAEEGIQEMERRSGCQVRKIVYPYVSMKDYFVSENGDFFTLHFEKYRNKRWCVDIIIPRDRGTAMRGISVSFQTNKKQVQVKLEKLVYCTFVLGDWNEDIDIDFKDGNHKNVHLENLAERGEFLTEDAVQRMEKYADVYQKNFDYVVRYVRFFEDIDTEDAEDITSKAFMYLCAFEQKEIKGDFVSLWIYYAKKKAQSFWLWRCKPRVGKVDEMEWLTGRNDTPIGLDILNVLPNERWKVALWQQAQGYSQEESAEELGVSVSMVRNYRRDAKNFMRQYLSTDREVMKIYG